MADRIHEGGFMDFLYPAQTLAFFRQLVSRDVTSFGHRQKRIIHPRSRGYTSSARDSTNSVGPNVVEGDTESIETRVTAGDEVRKRLSRLLENLDSTGNNEELWQTYQSLQDMSLSSSPAELMKLLERLSTSKTKIDIERALTLFAGIPVSERRASHYQHAIIASLSQDDLETALNFHREAIPRVQGSLGTSAILLYTVQREQWQPAIETWHGYWFYRQMYFGRPTIWTEVDALPLTELMDKAASAADFAIGMAESTSQDSAVAARDFALQLILRSFTIRKTKFDPRKQEELFEKARALKEPELEMYRAAILQLLSIDSHDHGRAAIQRYRRLRNTTEIQPDLSLMNAILNRLCAIRSSAAVFMILEDYRRYHDGPPAAALKKIIDELARQGNSEAVFTLFEEFRTRFGTPENPDLYNSLLFVYFRRGQVEKVVEVFQSLQDDYGFVPNLKSWNFVIATFARVGDNDGALSWYKKLSKNNLKPDSNTYLTMMAMYAKRGDLEAVASLFQQSRTEDVRSTIPMLDNLVLAQVNSDQVAEARETAEKALRMDLDGSNGSRTRMWNILLNAYAMRRDFEKISEIHHRMQEAGVPSDGMTYAALMQSLVIAKQIDAAQKILLKIMPQLRIRASPLHYAIVMGGFLAVGNHLRVFALYDRMLKRNVMPVPSTQNVVLRAAASVDIDKADKDVTEGEPMNFSRAHEILEQTLANMDPMELARNEPVKFFGVSRLDEAFSSSYFSYLIFLYGRRNALDKVSELYDRYTTTAQKFRQDVEFSPPIQMLTALMVAHLQADDHEEVERCWYLALDKAEKLARRSTASDLSEPGWVLPSRRFIMNIPLLHYMKSLEAQNRINDLTATIDDLHFSGYALTNKSWNAYIQVLVRNDQQNLAYELCERELMDGWPSWEAMGGSWRIKDRFRAMGPSRLQPDKRMPSYPTFVFLAGAYMDAQSGDITRLEGWRKVAPRTVDAVRNMPKLDDDWQARVLKRY